MGMVNFASIPIHDLSGLLPQVDGKQGRSMSIDSNSLIVCEYADGGNPEMRLEISSDTLSSGLGQIMFHHVRQPEAGEKLIRKYGLNTIGFPHGATFKSGEMRIPIRLHREILAELTRLTVSAPPPWFPQL